MRQDLVKRLPVEVVLTARHALADLAGRYADWIEQGRGDLDIGAAGRASAPSAPRPDLDAVTRSAATRLGSVSEPEPTPAASRAAR